MKQHYQTLGLEEGASQEDIKEAYSRLSKELNPANNDNQEFFKEEYAKVQVAYKALYSTSILATEQGAKKASKIKSTNKATPAVEKKVSNNIKTPKKAYKIWLSLLIILFIVLTVSGYFILKPETYTIQETIEVEGVTKTKIDLQPITGKIKGRGYYKNGKRNGKHETWNDSLKQKESEGEYILGKENGLWRFYYENGQLKKEISYEKGLKNGSFKFWNKKTILTADRMYTADRLSGLNKSWNDKGVLKQVADYSKDYTQTYNPEGILQYEGPFVKSASEWTGNDQNRSSLSLAPLEPKLKWRYKIGGQVYIRPSVSNGVVFVGSSDNYLYALDQYTGALKWRYKTGLFRVSPSVSNGLVFVGSSDGYIYAFGN